MIRPLARPDLKPAQSFADAEAKYRSARAFVYGAWDALIPLAREIQRLFHRFCEENLKEFPGPEGKTITMAVAIAQTEYADKGKVIGTLKYITNHELIFLGLAMAAGKAIADPARDVEYSTVVTAMCRNGVEFGIRVSGLGDEWFTAPAPAVDGLYLPGYSADDAGLDMGDSAITETVGWGGFVLGGAPGILSLVGGTPEEALNYSREMKKITVAVHPTYRLPALGFVGTSIGIDIRLIVQTNITPIIDTAIAHKDPGFPKIGAGLVHAPKECFRQALIAFGKKYSA